MSAVEEIKTAISQLTLQERLELNAWLHPVEADDWDRQMDVDSEKGNLDFLFEEAREK